MEGKEGLLPMTTDRKTRKLEEDKKRTIEEEGSGKWHVTKGFRGVLTASQAVTFVNSDPAQGPGEAIFVGTVDAYRVFFYA